MPLKMYRLNCLKLPEQELQFDFKHTGASDLVRRASIALLLCRIKSVRAGPGSAQPGQLEALDHFKVIRSTFV